MDYSDFLPLALAFAHRFFAAADILALAAALIFFLFFRTLVGTESDVPKIEYSSLVNAAIFSFRSAARRSCLVVNDNRSLIVR